MMVSKLQRSDGDIKIAVNAWCEDPVTATVKYGHISKMEHITGYQHEGAI